MAVLKTLLFLKLVVLYFSFITSASETDDYIIDGVNLDDKSDDVPTVEEDKTWPGFPYLGQVSGIVVDGDGNLHIFHRGDRVWDAQTFDRSYRLTDTEQGPIQNDTIVVVDPNNGKVLYSWGAGRFYMPHGLTVDKHGNTWVTDVGLHQVFKFPARELNPELELGEPFVPGAGKNHLCQPSDVAVTSNGYFFVSDGYCNSRLLMFSRNGRLLKEIGSKDGMNVPHSLTLIPEHDAVCVADRENSRILCYSTGTDGTTAGVPLASIDSQGRVFALDKRRKQLFALNGPDLWENTQSVSANHGLVIDVESGIPRILWGPDNGFLFPHDLAVSPDGNYVYVSEIDLSAPKRVYKFNIWD
ncbi:peptidyl-alpha-hydroxyglycine alpha-amidating lyase 2-like [Stegodyphus dumicola]|uniref:peptidyl-alpha-hydroxyglycine alpha-amidating lyase 2-like n=1 Tax=Stegodyphus dumicola TaxID=202533 RepID=UPI0015AF7BE2|nr:peptidyl-alpha-hydroxyglycine alpha-amidating lyase 2-like [Stegodyphus dumicola]